MASRWFATSPFAPDAPMWWSGTDPSQKVYVHAKELGTVISACGKSTTSWVKYWVGFQAASVTNACPDCVRAVQARAPEPELAGFHLSD